MKQSHDELNISLITQMYQEGYLKVKKYQYSMAETTLRECQLKSYLKISDTGHELLIYNERLKKHVESHKYFDEKL